MAFTGDVNNIVLPSPKNLPTIGGVYYGPLNAAIPDAAFTIATSMKKLGYVSDAGLSEKEVRSTQKKYAWGSDLVADPQDHYDLEVTFELFEFLNPEVAKVAYNAANVTVTAATTTTGHRLSILQTSDVLDMHTWLFDTYSPGGKRVQKFIPLGRVTMKDPMIWSHKDILSHKVTVTCFPDTSGAHSYTRTDDGILDAS
jgi:hypothetical protein